MHTTQRVCSPRMAPAGAMLAALVFTGWACAADGVGGLRPLPSVPDRPLPELPLTRDPQVVPAGVGCRDGRCRGGRCNHAHLAGCRHGHCVPHCPVRPEYFGYYGTRWRRWPGSGVVQVSAESVATPVPPARSAVPSADEESPAATQPRSLLPEDDAADAAPAADDDAAVGERRGAAATPRPPQEERGGRTDDPDRDSVGAVRPGMVPPSAPHAEPALEVLLPGSPAAFFRSPASQEGVRPVTRATPRHPSGVEAAPRVGAAGGLPGGWRRFVSGAGTTRSLQGTPQTAAKR
jgi:hypothetical protein